LRITALVAATFRRLRIALPFTYKLYVPSSGVHAYSRTVPAGCWVTAYATQQTARRTLGAVRLFWFSSAEHGLTRMFVVPDAALNVLLYCSPSAFRGYRTFLFLQRPRIFVGTFKPRCRTSLPAVSRPTPLEDWRDDITRRVLPNAIYRRPLPPPVQPLPPLQSTRRHTEGGPSKPALCL